jgi:wyosine [tRNA(Phe)-imidazoG37] synthetase (radical SAM superfamily)
MTSHIYGPVPSRRLGRSLGIDLVPYKTCTYDCIYCQLGRTTNKTIERKEWVPLDDILSQLKEALPSNPDYITLSGSGEPTLHSRIRELIAEIKRLTDIPVAVLTNGSLLWQPDIVTALIDADLVVPSLDAYDEESFGQVNRPHEAISFKKMVDGLAGFRKKYPGRVWLEVFLLDGLTGSRPEIERMAEIAEIINPDKVQLNTVARPPAESHAKAVGGDLMMQFAGMFGERGEVVADISPSHREPDFAALREDIFNLLKRRPCTIDDIANGLGLHKNEVIKYVEELISEGRIKSETRDGKKFYEINR